MDENDEGEGACAGDLKPSGSRDTDRVIDHTGRTAVCVFGESAVAIRSRAGGFFMPKEK